MKITEFFVKRPTLFWSLMVGILLAGIFAFTRMPKLEDPAVAVKQAMVMVPYMGASAHEVELKVAQVMEDELRTLPDVRKITTECHDGMAQFTVEFNMSVPNAEVEQHFDQLRRKTHDVESKLPQGCYSPIVVDDMMDVYGIFYAFTGDGYTYPELYKYAKMIRRELLAVKGVKRVNLVGNRDEVINITLSKEKIARNGVIPTQIMMALQNAGKTVNAGAYETGGDKIQLRVNEAIEDERDIENLMFSTFDGKQLRIGDIATVERTYAEPQTYGFFVNGKPAIAICLAMQADAIVPDIGELVDAKLAETMQRVPAGMETEKIFFQPDKVTTAINSFMVNLVESVLIVIIALIFTMGFRSGLIIGFGLILTISVSFPILLTLGTTLQRISLGAFIIAMGMLVDNAIVIMDGILVDKRRGMTPDVYLYRIGRNTAMPLLGATIIAAATFLAIYLSPGSTGEYAGDLFLVICVSLLASWVLALVQVPMCAKQMFAKDAIINKEATPEGQLMNSPVHRFVRGSISFLIGYKKTTITLAFVVLFTCFFGMTKVKNLFFPDFDYSQFIVEYWLPSQSSPDRVKHDLLEMSDWLQENPEVTRVAASMGSAPAHYCLVRPMTAGGNCYGELMVDCKDYKTVVEQIPAIRDTLRTRYPDAYIRIRKYNFSITTTHTVEAQFAGPDPAVLRDLASQAEEVMRRCPYVDPYSVQNNWKPKGKTLVADYVRQDALRSGIERSDVGNALMAATDGMTVGVINDQDRSVMINLMVRNADGTKIQDLREIPVWSTMNMHVTNEDLQSVMRGTKGAEQIQDDIYKSVPLGNVTSDVRLSWDEEMVIRVNGQRTIEAECDPNPYLEEATPAKVLASIQEEIEQIPLPTGYSLKWVGEIDTQEEANENLLGFLPLTFFIILLILLLLFNNWKKVLLILVCFPFVFCGITPSLLGFGQPFTFMAIIGMMGLIGMMVKNAIVLMDEIGRLQEEEHKAPYVAVVEATVSRVRPVLMASLTTIIGMVPLLGDPMYGSMAICIMGGLAMGTIITLILFPLFYTAAFHIKKEI
ncbi:efflux RND transporter permease subunit [Parabacteroides distasonis]|nr:efflux RND transporter permease subunit [Parabacteroides distasonis]